jgi:ribosomal-protein-alanine N-acetyltransferase
MSATDPNPIIRQLVSKDVPEIAALEALCPEAALWGNGGYSGLASAEISGWGAEIGGNLVAFVVVRVVSDEMEILNLAVNPNHRRMGLATKLVLAALSSGRERRVIKASLEVRDSNSTARAFYQSQGFNDSGRRKGYYSHPYEDAIVLTLLLT